MASFPPRVNEKEIGEAQDGGGARGRRAECEGAGSGAGRGERGAGVGVGDGRRGKSDAEAHEKRGIGCRGSVEAERSKDRRCVAGGSGPAMGVGRE